ncbi:ATP-binding protein [Mesorhizobium loti]|nr:ATP-binding protein [Mesorhizobium loti]
MRKQHRSPKRPAGDPMPPSRISFQIQVTGAEHKRRALGRGVVAFPTNNELRGNVLSKHFEQTNSYEIVFQEGSIGMPGAPTYGLFEEDTKLTAKALVNTDRSDFKSAEVFNQNPPEDHTTSNLSEVLQATTFVFDAERYNIGRSAMDGSDRLLPNAQNLPYMLLKLNKDHKKTEQYQSLVSEVLPHVQRVLVSALGAEVEISVQSDPSMRADLAIPLDDCGTGVAQVLAILYVVVAYDAAQIIIDEPNSFLHPGATRRLLNVIKRYDNHQFLLSTHTADVISILRPEKLFLLRWNPDLGETELIVNSGTDIEHLRTSLAELGASLTDVFGFDVVVFVEGPTEKECFHLLVPKNSGVAINFVPMRDPSGLTTIDAQAMFDIYRRGVGGSALEPPKSRFSFDREGRSQKQIEDIERASKGTAIFLPRPMLENYLLQPEAIAATIALLYEEYTVDGTPVAVGKIKDWIEKSFIAYPVTGVKNESPLFCDAAKLLAALFPALTEGKFEYRKIEYGRKLTEWLIHNDPEYLVDLRGYVGRLLSV